MIPCRLSIVRNHNVFMNNIVYMSMDLHVEVKMDMNISIGVDWCVANVCYNMNKV